MTKIPQHLQPKMAKTGELFQNSILEKLTRTSIYIPLVMHTLIASVFLYYAVVYTPISYVIILALFFLGWLTWTFAEYSIHRWFYHGSFDSRWLKKIQYMGHGIHHSYPKDAERLAMPPLPALILIALFFGTFYMISGIYAVAFFPGFLIGYVLYIGIHYAQHIYKVPKLALFKKLWKYHALHHYKYPDTKVFGVSTLLWDRVFGTLPDQQKKSI